MPEECPSCVSFDHDFYMTIRVFSYNLIIACEYFR